MKKSLDEKINEIELRKKGIAEDSDGLRRCLRCGAPLQRREIDHNGEMHLIYVSCDCLEIQNRQRTEIVREDCFMSDILSTYKYDSHPNKGNKANPYLKKFIRKFLKIKKSGVSLYIYSPSDQSRVFNLARISNGLIDHGHTVKHITAPLFSSLRRIPNADYTKLMKKLSSFDAVAFADLDLITTDEKELSFLCGVMSFLVNSNVTLLISSDKHIYDINPETYYGQKIKELIKKRCIVIPIQDDVEEINPQKVARDELWMFVEEDIKHEK